MGLTRRRAEHSASFPGSYTSPTRFRAGDLVWIRSEAEILGTLDASGCLEGLPFMPEMLPSCGQIARVSKRAHKTCDSFWRPGIREMDHAVFLEGRRCDGTEHGGCRAACLFFWKEQWLRPVVAASDGSAAGGGSAAAETTVGGCTREVVFGAARAATVEAGTPRYRCQATEIVRATLPLSSLDVRQYVADVTSRNVGVVHLVRTLSARLAERASAPIRSRMRRFRTVTRQPTPPPRASGRVGLQAGDWVAVRPKHEIQATLDANSRNRGLSFNREMERYCGGRYRVRGRVDQVINEKTGEMHQLHDCIILEDVTCQGDFHRFCPRAVYPWWREVWLEKLQ
jgi:hypothetical protein